MPRFDTPLITNDSSIDRVLHSELPLALIIWRGAALDSALDETLRQIARNDAGRVLVARLNTDENPQAATRAQGLALPVVITYRHGEEISRTGAAGSQAVREHVDYLLGRGPRPSEPAPPTDEPQARQATPAKPVTVSDATFRHEVLESQVPVLVDLWAPWCGPCRMIAPVVERLAGEYAGRLKIAKLNVDENPRIPGQYGVQGIPTLLLLRNGQVVDRVVGAAPEPMLRARINAVLHPN